MGKKIKKHITNKQLLELDDEQTEIFYDFLDKDKDRAEWIKVDYNHIYNTVNIGVMIEFLGDDWLLRLYWVEDYEKNKSSRQRVENMHLPVNEDLCNQLWEACKYKLENSNEEQKKYEHGQAIKHAMNKANESS